MPVNQSEKLKALVDLIREVKPSVGDSTIKLDDSLVEDLGLDSLDIMQLARKVRRVLGPEFNPQAWAANHREHNYSVRSLVDATPEPSASEVKGPHPVNENKMGTGSPN